MADGPAFAVCVFLCISVYDVLAMLAQGMSEAEIIADFPELDSADIPACLAYGHYL